MTLSWKRSSKGLVGSRVSSATKEPIPMLHSIESPMRRRLWSKWMGLPFRGVASESSYTGSGIKTKLNTIRVYSLISGLRMKRIPIAKILTLSRWSTWTSIGPLKTWGKNSKSKIFRPSKRLGFFPCSSQLLRRAILKSISPLKSKVTLKLLMTSSTTPKNRWKFMRSWERIRLTRVNSRDLKRP